MEEKEFQFVEEEIKPRKKRLFIKWLKRILIMIVSGMVFGAVAAVAFFYVGGYMRNNVAKATPTPVPSPTSVPMSTPLPSPTATPVKEDTTEYNRTIHSFSDLYSAVAEFCELNSDTIVTVSKITEGTDFFEKPVINSDSFSGLVIKIDNEKIFILTEYDGLKENNKYKIVFRNGASTEAEIVGTDSTTGLAVISADMGKLDTDTIESVRTAVIGNSDSIKVGDFVIAMGSPMGNMYSNMYGIVGGSPEIKNITDRQISLFRTDMRYINDGSGVIMNVSGHVVGIITHRFDEENSDVLTFIGISEIYYLIRNLMENGVQTVTGVTASDIPQDLYEELGVTSGIYVTDVMSDSPAMEAGLSVGDVILSIDDKQINNVDEYAEIISAHKTGDTLPVVIYRTYSKSNKVKNFKITLKDTSI